MKKIKQELDQSIQHSDHNKIRESQKYFLALSIIFWIIIATCFYFYYRRVGYEIDYLKILTLGVIVCAVIFIPIISANLFNKKLIRFLFFSINIYAFIYSIIIFLYLSGNLNFFSNFISFFKPIYRIDQIDKIKYEDRKLLIKFFTIARNEPKLLSAYSNNILKLISKYPDFYLVHSVYALYLVEEGDKRKAEIEFKLAAQYASQNQNKKGEVENLIYLISKIHLQQDNYKEGLELCNKILKTGPDNHEAKIFKKYFEDMLRFK